MPPALADMSGSPNKCSEYAMLCQPLGRRMRCQRRPRPLLLIAVYAMLEPSPCLGQSASGVSGPRRPTMTPSRNANLIGSHCNTWAPDLRQSSRVAGCWPRPNGVPTATPAPIYKTLSLILTSLVTIGRLIICRRTLREADCRINAPNVICAWRRLVGLRQPAMDGYQVRPPGLEDEASKRKVEDFTGLYGLESALRPPPEHTGKWQGAAATEPAAALQFHPPTTG